MSIVRLTKITLFGSRSQEKTVLQELQHLGCVHLISQQKEMRSVEFRPLSWEESAGDALQYLLAAPQRRHQVLDEAEFDLQSVVTAALQNKQRHRAAIDQRIALTHRIGEISPWGNFVLPSPDELAGYHLWFYRLPHRQRAKLESVKEPFEIVATDHHYVYVVVISREEPPQNLLPAARTHVGAVSLDELKSRLQKLDVEIDELVAERSALSRWIHLLAKHLAEIEDQHALEQMQQQSRKADDLFVVQGWLPTSRLTALQNLAIARGLALLQEEPDGQEKPPTLLENPPAFEVGQDLVRFYETPAYRSWDPSIITMFSFAIFFAMILADAGYALVLVIPVLWFRKKLSRTAGGRRFLSLAIVILTAALVYGILVGSYFGVEPPHDSFLGAFHRIRINDLGSMMQISLIIGCAHLILANAASSYHASTLAGKLRPAGWIAMILGGLSLYLSKSYQGQSLLGTLGLVFLGIGIALLIGFGAHGADHPVTSFKDGVIRVLGGIGSLFEITKLFGDTLSYLRLFALGLASASLAITFNQIAGQIRQATPGFGVLLALLVLLLGHALNLLLGIVSGVVHGLRLNYIEFFNWSISEEGQPFKAFRKKEPVK